MQSEDICEHIVHKALAVFSSTVYSDNADFSISAGLLLWTVRSVSMRPNLKVKLTEDWVVSSSESAAAAGGNASALLSSFPRAFSADTSGAATALPTWQEYLVALLLHILTYENAEDNTAGSSTPMCRLQLAVASQMGILTAEHDLILSSTVRASATTAALFWKQKLWSRLFSKLHTGIGSTSTSGSGVNSASAFSTSASPSQSFVSVLRLLSVCTLSTGMPVNIMQDSLVQLVSVVVTAMSYKPASATAGGECAAYIGACAVMVQQSMCTLEVLLKHDAQLFIPYLNIVMPSLVEVLACFYVLLCCFLFDYDCLLGSF